MKALFALILAILVFGTGGYYTWKLYVEPQQKLNIDKQVGASEAPPDPTIGEYEKCVQIQQGANLLEARAAFTDFVERYPESTRIEEAKDHLGQINSSIFLSNIPSPEKETYIVQKGEVITRVAAKMRTTPELILRANNLRGTMLQIGQRLMVAPADFSLVIDRKQKKVVVLNNGKFFKQYPFAGGAAPHAVHATPASQAVKKSAPTPKPPKILGKVTERIAWYKGQRVTPFDKDRGQAYAEADHWIVIAPSGHSLYTEHDAAEGAPPSKPPGGGYALAPEAMQELAVMLNKNTPVTIE